MHKHAAHALALGILALGIAGECLSGAAIGKDAAAANSERAIVNEAVAINNDRVRQIAIAPPTASAFQPLTLPPGAVLRGISLSGKGCMQQVDTARYKLTDGCAMLHTAAPATVEAGPGTAVIDSRTTAVIHVAQHATRFVNLTDHHRHSMLVKFGNHFIELEPGYELVLVEGSKLNPKSTAVQENIGYKDMHQLCTDNLCVFVYRVSAADVISKCRIYMQLAQSPLDVDRVLRDELLKSVAALETMYNKKRGPYELDPFQYGS